MLIVFIYLFWFEGGAGETNGSYQSTSGAGGSGIVIVRFLTSDAVGLTVSGGVSSTFTAYTVVTFTSVGSTSFFVV